MVIDTLFMEKSSEMQVIKVPGNLVKLEKDGKNKNITSVSITITI